MLPMSQLFKIALCVCMASLWVAACTDSETTAESDSEGSQTQPQNDGPIPDTGNAVGPEGDSRLEVLDEQFPLQSALGDIWGVEDEHYSVDFTITNGKFLLAPTEIDGVLHSLLVPAQATATIYAELYSPGESFSYGTFSFSSSDSGVGSLSGISYFENAYVGFDSNESGDIESDENIRVIGGTFEFSGALPDIELNFDVTLENGQQAVGHYTGLFDFAERN